MLLYINDDFEKRFVLESATKHDSGKAVIETHISLRYNGERGWIKRHITHVEKCALLRIIN